MSQLSLQHRLYHHYINITFRLRPGIQSLSLTCHHLKCIPLLGPYFWKDQTQFRCFQVRHSISQSCFMLLFQYESVITYQTPLLIIFSSIFQLSHLIQSDLGKLKYIYKGISILSLSEAFFFFISIYSMTMASAICIVKSVTQTDPAFWLANLLRDLVQWNYLSFLATGWVV